MSGKELYRSSRLRTVIITIVSALALAVTGGVVAQASNWAGATGNTGCTTLNMADNGDHTYYYSDLTVAMSAAVTWTRFNNLNPTDMNSSGTTSPTSNTDVIVYDNNYTDYCGYTWNGPGSGVVGLVQCVSTTSNSRCQKHEMRFDTSYTSGASTTNQRSLACHENGHTIGLAHYSSGCMTQSISGSTTYTQHDINHINAAY